MVPSGPKVSTNGEIMWAMPPNLPKFLPTALYFITQFTAIFEDYFCL